METENVRHFDHVLTGEERERFLARLREIAGNSKADGLLAAIGWGPPRVRRLFRLFRFWRSRRDT